MLNKFNLFIRRQIKQIRSGGVRILFKKIICTFRLFKYIYSFPIVGLIRLIKPIILIRIDQLNSSRIGHFAANTELYLCEKDAGINIPRQRYLDIFYLSEGPVCNKYLTKMWKKKLNIMPHLIIDPIFRLNDKIPGGEIHNIFKAGSSDRDTQGLFKKYPQHLYLSKEEERLGLKGLEKLQIPSGSNWICLIVRDSAYLESHQKKDWSYHNYRDCDIDNFNMIAKKLAELGYYVIRMGVKVKKPMARIHQRVIDYANSGQRTDFMDIYLGANCLFCITTGTGFEAVPHRLFRKPLVFVNMVPVGYVGSYFTNSIGIFKHHFSKNKNRNLQLSEIISSDIGYALDSSIYDNYEIDLIENTPQEIYDVVLEMIEVLKKLKKYSHEEQNLQTYFWKRFISLNNLSKKHHLHGVIHARIGTKFLESNKEWIN